MQRGYFFTAKTFMKHFFLPYFSTGKWITFVIIQGVKLFLSSIFPVLSQHEG